jgi:hypothetical protein
MILSVISRRASGFALCRRRQPVSSPSRPFFSVRDRAFTQRRSQNRASKFLNAKIFAQRLFELFQQLFLLGTAVYSFPFPTLPYRSKRKTDALQFLNLVLVFGKPFQNSIQKFRVTQVLSRKHISFKVGRICTSKPPVDQTNRVIGLYDDVSHGNIKVGHDHAVAERAFKRRTIA